MYLRFFLLILADGRGTPIVLVEDADLLVASVVTVLVDFVVQVFRLAFLVVVLMVVVVLEAAKVSVVAGGVGALGDAVGTCGTAAVDGCSCACRSVGGGGVTCEAPREVDGHGKENNGGALLLLLVVVCVGGATGVIVFVSSSKRTCRVICESTALVG